MVSCQNVSLPCCGKTIFLLSMLWWQISILSFTYSQSPIYQPNWNAKKSA